MDERKVRASCGTHVELARTGGVRITRCACGTLHLHVARSGVTLQIGEDSLADLAAATAEAARELAAGTPRATVPSSCAN